MGLDAKEKNLLKFLGKHILPPCVIIPYVYKKHFIGKPFELIGFLYIAYLVYKIVLYPLYFKAKITTWGRVDVRKYGKYAVVTGGTSGIGEAFVHTFGRKGMNVIVVSRSQDKLDRVKKEFEEKYDGLKCEVIAYDFNQNDKKVLADFQGRFTKVVEKVGGIGVLVNNVGMSNDDPEYLHLIDQGLIDSMLNVNNNGTIMMSRLCLPFMMKQRKGAVICVSSASCTHPTPLLSCYSATKGFGNQLTRSMFYEYKEFGIDCLSITPYYFVSNMFKRRRETRMAPFPERIIDSALPLLGHVGEANPYIGHWVMGQIGLNYWDTGNGLLGIMKRNKARAEAKKAMKGGKKE